MQSVCTGLRVFDLSTIDAGAMTTMVLADFGAEVIRIEPPEETAAQRKPSDLLLNRGKKSVRLDLKSAAGRQEAVRLALACDIVVETMRPGEAEQRGLDYAALSRQNPALIHCSITGFGRTGPLAQVKADDALAMAHAGIYRDQRGWDTTNRPVFRANRDATFFAGMLAVQGIIAALRVRDLTGKGQQVETNLMQALASRQNPAVRWLLREGEELPKESAGSQIKIQAETALPHHLDPRSFTLAGARVECKDGRWIVHSHSEPHFYPAWIEALGLAWTAKEERFKDAPRRFPDQASRDELGKMVRDRMKEKTATEWMAAYVANGDVCGDVIQTTQDALQHPQSVESGIVIEIEDPQRGPIVEVGPLVKISGAPPCLRGSAPRPGEHTEEILKAALAPSPRPAPTGVKPTRPLEGITILESAYYYATPFATALLAELGARVIKVEPLKGDPYRKIYGAGDPVLCLGHNNMVRAMSGKESIALDLKDPRGQKILHALVKKADIFVHNFRLGVPERLGMDYETIRKINPKIMYQYGASYGSTGPHSRLPAIDPVIAAFAGSTAHQAGQGNRPLTETGADPVAAVGCATAMILGLYAKLRTGQSQYVESAMVVSNIYLNYEDALCYEGKPPRRSPDQGQLGLSATYRLYETAPAVDRAAIDPHGNQDPRWVFLAAESDEEFAKFCKVADRADVARDPRFATQEARAANDSALAALIEGVFLTRPALEWEKSLIEAGVGCVMADAMSHFTFLYRDPQAQAIGMMSESHHPEFGGKYWRYAPMVRLSATPAKGGSFCAFGDHTDALLAEIGYDEATRAQLREAGVVA
jgi:crotonobetainyl-CoA:carnitine CoA-transferase CaiB-like acyl-CoA transferase